MGIGDDMSNRIRELQARGFDWEKAAGHAWLEHRISEWPSAWGNDLVILIYGDFKPPTADVHIQPLGITIHHEKLEKTVIRSARCVLKATVKIEEKSVEALIEAVRRINVLLGSWTLVTWGNSPCRWWSWVTHDSGSGVSDPLAHKELSKAINGILQLPFSVRQRVDAALYWIREPRNLLMEFPRNDLLRIYVAYWNAFECLVEAVNILRPQQKLSKSEKQQKIDAFIAERSGKLSVSDIQDCYQDIINPGLVGSSLRSLRL